MPNEKKNGQYTETLPNGSKCENWYKNGQLHREDGPAYVYIQPDGTKTEYWYKNGKCHREDGPAFIEIWSNGSKTEIWYKNGQYHREDGPAYVAVYPNGYKTEIWYKNGKYHRENGPAYVVVRPDGIKTEEWYLNGAECTAVAQFISKQVELQMVAERFVETVQQALDNFRGPKTGMQVPYHGDFANMFPSTAKNLEWWANLFRSKMEKDNEEGG